MGARGHTYIINDEILCRWPEMMREKGHSVIISNLTPKKPFVQSAFIANARMNLHVDSLIDETLEFNLVISIISIYPKQQARVLQDFDDVMLKCGATPVM